MRAYVGSQTCVQRDNTVPLNFFARASSASAASSTGSMVAAVLFLSTHCVRVSCPPTPPSLIHLLLGNLMRGPSQHSAAARPLTMTPQSASRLMLKRSLRSDASMLRSVGGKETELALSSTLQKIGVDIDQIDIHLKNGQRFSWRKQKGIIELPPVIRKEIWRKAIVHDRKLFICSRLYVPHFPSGIMCTTNIMFAATVKQTASSPFSLLSLAHLAVSVQRLFPSSTRRTTFNTRFPTQAITALAAG
jgi:hypothetical protein